LLFAVSRPEPKKIELVYFPYYLFEPSLQVKGDQRSVFVASDGVLGELAFVRMETLDLLDEVDAPSFDFQIDVERANRAADAPGISRRILAITSGAIGRRPHRHPSPRAALTFIAASP
jgi:hypothetical protein